MYGVNFKYPFLYLFIALAGGIICSEYLTFSGGIYCIPLLGLAFFIRKSRLVADLLLLSCVFFIGIEISTIKILNFSDNTPYLIQGRCKEILTNHHYILSVGKQHYYVNHIHTDTFYQPGDSLHFFAQITPFHPTQKPGEFSYARYLKQKRVFHQLIPLSPIERKGASHTLSSFFYQLREHIRKKTNLLTSDSTCQKLINALCLGYKNDLDAEFRNLFTNTGTIHLLSVSGLHTGALYLFFLFILKHIGLKHRKSELLLLPILWGYACLTGLAPSVVRASTILSFMALGNAFHRTYTPLNALSASAFFTLLIDPAAIYSMSFLLSYSAYAGILILYPYLYQLPGHLPSYLAKIYACCCVTIAAQLPTLPLCAYYFHSININGFIANLIAVPIATLFLYGAACCLILPLWIAQPLSFLCEFMSNLLVKFLYFFAPHSINLSNLYPSLLLIIGIYGCLITTTYYLFHPQKRRRQIVLISYCSLLCYLIGHNIYLQSIREIVIMHHPKHSVILLQYDGFCIPIKNTLTRTLHHIPYIQLNKSKLLSPHTGLLDTSSLFVNNRFYNRHDSICLLSQNHTLYSACQILIITDNIQPTQAFTDSPPHLPSRIILDGSNSNHTIKQWNIFCQSHAIVLLHTAKNDFICLRLKPHSSQN